MNNLNLVRTNKYNLYKKDDAERQRRMEEIREKLERLKRKKN